MTKQNNDVKILILKQLPAKKQYIKYITWPPQHNWPALLLTYQYHNNDVPTFCRVGFKMEIRLNECHVTAVNVAHHSSLAIQQCFIEKPWNFWPKISTSNVKMTSAISYN